MAPHPSINMLDPSGESNLPFEKSLSLNSSVVLPSRHVPFSLLQQIKKSEEDGARVSLVWESG